MKEPSRSLDSAIAIVGMAGRFPGARNLDEFWGNLRAGIESLDQYSDAELKAAGVDPVMLAHPSYVKAGTSLERADEFDAAFFGINPREAEIMDPQQRLFLECAWQAIEDAGYDVDRLNASVGVFAGASMNSYLYANLLRNPQALAAVGAYQAMIGNDKDFLATRVSYKLNLRGPSLTLQTACSTSLVAVHVACQNLLTQQCDMALAGGVSLSFPQRSGYLYQEGMIASPDGKLRPFDANGRGIRAGEGVGAVLLKRLSDAIADRDAIRAVILGSAINNDGAQKIGYTAPSVDGQAEVIATAQSMADVDPATISYIEAHGTSTPLGDPIEIAALTRAFRARVPARQLCAIGSVKGNIGHLDAAAGIAGLIKTVLALQHAEIPPSLNFEAPNPQIDFANSPFFVNAALRPWNAATPRRAGVSSFGIGGTNAHAVLEEWQAPAVQTATAASGQEQQLVLSARSAPALNAAIAQLAAYLEARPETNLADVAYTLQTGRRVFEHRALATAADVASAAAALRGGRTLMRTAGPPGASVITFMFSGQGSQYAGMGWELYQSEPAFRTALDHCAGLLHASLGLDLRSVLYEEYARTHEVAHAGELLNQTWITQPALFAVEYSLAELWRYWGLQPQAMIGHSIGEYVAACLAGVFALDTALKLVVERGALMQRASAGAMLAVTLDEVRLRPHLRAEISIAALNAPGNCVVAGPTESIDALQRRLEQAGVPCRRLRTSHAFHSGTMDAVVPPFVARIARESLQAPSIPFLSNLTGTWITAEQATDPGYWGRHLRGAVRFADGLRTLGREPRRLLIEVGPGNTLGTFVQQTLGTGAPGVLSSLPHPRDRTSAAVHARRALGRAWLAGAPVDWQAANAACAHRVPLPTYPFESRRFWVEPLPLAALGAATAGPEPLERWFWLPSWLRTLRASTPAPLQADASPHWLVFANEDATSAAVLEALRLHGLRLTVVRHGVVFCEQSDGYRIRAAVRDDYAALLERQVQFDGIVHLWNAGAPDSGPLRLDVGRRDAFYSLLFLAQALGDHSRRVPLMLLAVSTDMQRVDGSEQLRPEKSLVTGPVLVMSQDVPMLQARSVDLAAHEWLPDNAQQLADMLLFEATHPTAASATAWRNGYRWEQTSAPLTLPASDTAELPLRERGVYLITGGTGGLGLALARSLATTHRARLVLLSRGGAPRDAAFQNEIAEMERRGAEVLVLAADVADPQQMSHALAESRVRFGGLHGVVHAAGLPGRGILQLKTAELCEAVLRPKLEGTLILQGLLEGAQLDFLALFSSVNSAYGWLGTADYSSANAFLDAYAQAGIGNVTRRVVAINWGAWGEVGMAAHSNNAAAIAPEQGVQAFYRALATDATQLFVTPIPLPHLVATAAASVAQAHRDMLGASGLLSAPAVNPSGQHERPPLSNEFIAPRTGEEQQLALIWSDLLGITPIGIEDNFFDLGGHSLLATRLLARVQDAFHVRLPMRAIFETSTISGVLGAIRSLQPAARPARISAAEQEREEIEL